MLRLVIYAISFPYPSLDVMLELVKVVLQYITGDVSNPTGDWTNPYNDYLNCFMFPTVAQSPFSTR